MKKAVSHKKCKLIILVSLLLVIYFASAFGYHGASLRTPSSTQEEYILYPGKFDPFHLSHYEELLYIKSSHPQSKAVILPIQEANYRSHPLLFTYDQKYRFIKETFTDIEGVQISSALQTIETDIFLKLLELRKTLPVDATVSIVIGTDILEIWQARSDFDFLLKQYNLIISKDPKNPELFEKLQNSFSKVKNIFFVDSGTEGIRSSKIKKDLLKNSNELKDVLPKTGVNFLQKHPEFRQEVVEQYAERLHHYLVSRVNNELIPLMEQNSVNSRLIQIIKKYPDAVNQLIFLDPKRLASVGEVAEAIRSIIPTEIINNSWDNTFDHLTRDLLLIVKEASVETFLSDQSYSFDRDQMQLIRAQKMVGRSLSQKLLFSFMGKLRKVTSSFPLMENLLLRFRNFATKLNITDSYALHKLISLPHTSSQKITVYRGIKAKANIAEVIDYTKKHGFISKVALDELIRKGKKLEDAVRISDETLKEQGLNNSIVDHIGGNWRKGSTFVATTLDYDVAAQWAQKGGYVFKFEIPIDLGYFVNDPIYWKSTPWDQHGNIQKSLNEFVVKNRIPPEMIVDYFQVKETPQEVVNDTYDSLQVWRAIPWKIKQRYNKYLPSPACSSLML